MTMDLSYWLPRWRETANLYRKERGFTDGFVIMSSSGVIGWTDRKQDPAHWGVGVTFVAASGTVIEVVQESGEHKFRTVEGAAS